MVNTKQGRYILEKYPKKVLMAALESGIPKMLSQVLLLPQILRILNVPYDSDGNTFLHLAVMLRDNNDKNTLDMIKILIRYDFVIVMKMFHVLTCSLI